MSNKITTLYKFEDFCLDTYNKRLFYCDSPVSLTPKALQTLIVLLKNRHQIVDKDFLLNEVWADTFVEETTLSQNILTLRKTFATFQKNKEFIVTFPRRGFRFVADVEEIIGQDEIIIVEKKELTHIIAEQQIHDSLDTKSNDTTITLKNNPFWSHSLTPRRISFAMVGLICAIFGGLSTWFFLKGQNEPKTQNIRLSTLASDSTIKNAVISPNGKYLALVKKREGNQSLSLEQIENGNTIEIIPKLNGILMGFTFSPDNEQIYYSIEENEVGMLYKVSIFGGASQMVLKNIDSPASISPDKTQIAFIRKNVEKQNSSLIIANIDGKSERILATDNPDTRFNTSGVAWSPDGENLSLIANQILEKQTTVQIYIVNSQTGEAKILSSQDWNQAGQTLWLKNGQGIVVSAFRENSPTVSDELWLISYPDGKAKFLTNGIKVNLGLSLNNENNSIVALKSEKLTCFLSASLDNFRKSNHIATRVGDSCQFSIGADWTIDGKIIYSTTEGGNADLWTINEDGSGKKQLTSDESAEISPQLSKDGRYLIFLSNRSGKMSIWRSNVNGTNPIQLTQNENVKEIIASPDGSFIFYLAQSFDSKTETLGKVSVNGENNQRITSKTTRSPRISPDGKMIAAYYPNNENKMSLALISSENGEVVRYLETPPHDDIPFLDWAKKGENLYLILREGKVYSIWKLDLATNKSEKIREWENDAIFRFVISKDGERVFYEVGTEINSVVQLENND